MNGQTGADGAVAVRPADETASTAIVPPRRVLLVDDEEDFLCMLAMVLSKGGYEVRGESDPRRAVEVAARFRPDVVLLDVMMPEVDGGDVAARLRAHPTTARVPIVFLTALVGVQDAPGRAPFISGGQRYLPKPVSMEELERCIAEVVGPPGAAGATAADDVDPTGAA